MEYSDSIQVMDGPFNGREGEVKHLYRGTAFIYNRKVDANLLPITLHLVQHMENGGIFVAKARHLSLAGSTTNTAQNFIPMSPRVQQSPKHQSGAGASPWQVNTKQYPRFLSFLGWRSKIAAGHENSWKNGSNHQRSI